MRKIGDTSWEEVFESWTKSEASNPGWIHCATVIKGWPDWESWRKASAAQFDAANRQWELHEFTDPAVEIPQMLVGPYPAWQNPLPEKNKLSFQELLERPDQYERFDQHETVNSIIASLPFETQLMGVIREDINRIVCLEGTHRSAAITLAKMRGQQVDYSKNPVKIALTRLPSGQSKLIDEMLIKGTSKPQ